MSVDSEAEQLLWAKLDSLNWSRVRAKNGNWLYINGINNSTTLTPPPHIQAIVDNHSNDLPDEVERKWDSGQQKWYYVNHRTKTTSWERPTPVPSSQTAPGSLRANQSPAKPTMRPTNLPSGWDSQWSKEERKWYYINHATKTTTWESPVSTQGTAQETSSVMPTGLPNGWEAKWSEDQQRWYYVDHFTQQTTWTRPNALPSSYSAPIAPQQSEPRISPSLSPISTHDLLTQARLLSEAKKQSASPPARHSQSAMSTHEQLTQARLQSEASMQSVSPPARPLQSAMSTYDRLTQARKQSEAAASSPKQARAQPRFQSQAQLNASKARNQWNSQGEGSSTVRASMPMLDTVTSTRASNKKSKKLGASATAASVGKPEISPPNKTRVVLQKEAKRPKDTPYDVYSSDDYWGDDEPPATLPLAKSSAAAATASKRDMRMRGSQTLSHQQSENLLFKTNDPLLDSTVSRLGLAHNSLMQQRPVVWKCYPYLQGEDINYPPPAGPGFTPDSNQLLQIEFNTSARETEHTLDTIADTAAVDTVIPGSLHVPSAPSNRTKSSGPPKRKPRPLPPVPTLKPTSYRSDMRQSIKGAQRDCLLSTDQRVATEGSTGSYGRWEGYTVISDTQREVLAVGCE